MAGTRAVTGEEAGTRDVDKVTGAECLLGTTAVSRAIPDAPLLADTAEVGRQVRGRPKAGLTSRRLWSDLGESQKPRGVQAPNGDSRDLTVSSPHPSYKHRKWGCSPHQPYPGWTQPPFPAPAPVGPFSGL